MPDYAAAAGAYWSNQPHPRAPKLTIGEFATAVKLASLLKFGGHASPQEAELFMPQFKALQISPEEFEHAVDRLAPVSYTYHGRPPTLREVVLLKDEPPAKASAYFADLPDRHYPFVRAADMIKHLQAAEPHAQQYLGRAPVKLEAAQLAASGERPADYYARLAQPSPPIQERQGNISDSENVLHPEVGGVDRGRSLAPLGRPPLDQRNSPDRWGGLPAGREVGTAGEMGSRTT